MTSTTTRRRWMIRGTIMVFAVLDLATFGAEPVRTAAKSKLDRELTRALKDRTESTKRVIIRVSPGSRDRVKAKLRDRGQTAHGEHTRIDGLSAEVTLADVQALADDPEVLNVSSDAVVTGDAVTYDLTNARRANRCSQRSA